MSGLGKIFRYLYHKEGKYSQYVADVFFFSIIKYVSRVVLLSRRFTILQMSICHVKNADYNFYSKSTMACIFWYTFSITHVVCNIRLGVLFDPQGVGYFRKGAARNVLGI